MRIIYIFKEFKFMNQNTYFIIGGVAILLTIYYIFMARSVKKRRADQMDNFKANHSDSPLSDAQKRLLTFGAILSYHRDEEFLGIVPKVNLDTYIYGLRDQWGISNREEAIATLDDLVNLKRSSEINEIVRISSPEVTKTQKRIAKELGIELSIVEQSKSAYAWDTVRAVSLAKWCYWCTYLSEAETWSYMQKAVNVAQSNGRDWTDYTVSFLLGRTIQGFDIEEISIGCEQLMKSKNPLLAKIKDIDVYLRYSFK
jgi:hypothetical protein